MITLPGYGAARFDMAIPPLRWALEVDLHPEHRTPEGRARDSLRDVAAEGLGWGASAGSARWSSTGVGSR